MAGKTRVKISLEHVEPFWMFVDREESPLIINIQEKIEQRLEKVNVTSLFLDGCLLPSDETSQLLRDGDMVHVIVSECENQPDVNGSPQDKRDKKRKHSDENGEYIVSDSQASLAAKKLATSNANRKLKKKKEKKLLASKVQKLKEKKRRKKIIAEQIENNVASDDGGLPTHGLSTPVPEYSIGKTRNEVDTEVNVGTEKVSEMTGISNSTPIPEVTDSPVVGQRKRRRRGRKKANPRVMSQPENNSAKTLAALKQTPSELRIPKWQKEQNKKIVFSSESGEESGDNATINQVNNQEVGNKHQDTIASQASVQLDISDYNSSFSECFPASSSLSTTQGSLGHREVSNSKDVTGDGLRSNAGIVLDTTAQAPDVNMAEDVNGSASVNESAETEKYANEENGEDEWYRDEQYQEKLTEEMNLKRQCPSALHKSATPVHLYTGGHHEVVQPNLSEYLKMSPEERGATVPPYVTVRRLSNGAMVYSRSPVAASTVMRPASSPFKKPAYTPAKPSPRALSKKQQLETINTNKSIIVQNPPNSSTDIGATESEDARNVNPPTEGKALADDRETIVLTPMSREYSLFADLTAAPKPGDHIAYKVLEMGDDYTPGISDYKEAKVLKYDASSQNVTVKLLNLCTKKKTLGKFDLPEENPPEEEVTLELSTMFEPKLISSN